MKSKKVIPNSDSLVDESIPEAKWQQAVALSEIAIGDRYLFREGKRRIALFRVARDEFYAIDDACPHEGYPLIKGSVDGKTLTCQWHNFKFELSSGNA
ncbi:MAG: Rieske (2Fe-2S) protein [Kofleriaceae bacterium]|nr:Rieske (2Fe-2S) protein [Kofleriaceae bacterium]